MVVSHVLQNADVVNMIRIYLVQAMATMALRSRVREDRDRLLSHLMTLSEALPVPFRFLVIKSAMQEFDKIANRFVVHTKALRDENELRCFGVRSAMQVAIGNRMCIQEIQHFDADGNRKLSVWWPDTSSILVCRRILVNNTPCRHMGSYTYCYPTDELIVSHTNDYVESCCDVSLHFVFV